ncbi:MAG TPA: hypothetical protein VHD56_04480 [Tepidisphaeraceae bacterium]|nr:hypothetical protein [Tepidisphaeraceae bacterium]
MAHCGHVAWNIRAQQYRWLSINIVGDRIGMEQLIGNFDQPSSATLKQPNDFRLIRLQVSGIRRRGMQMNSRLFAQFQNFRILQQSSHDQ